MTVFVRSRINCVILCLMICSIGFSQSKDAFVPCQEMPDIMQKYNADFRALTRFYSPYRAGFGGNGGGGQGNETGAMGSPEKRERLERLYNEYVKKLDQINFKNLSQECKVDYILFKRDINEKIRTALKEDQQYEQIKKWIPFADKIYALEKIRRRGTQLPAEATAKEWFDMSNEIKTLSTKLKDEKGLDFDALHNAADAVTSVDRSLASIFDFYNAYDPAFTWWIPKSYKTLDDGLRAYSAQFIGKTSSFTSSDKSGIVGKPAGREDLMQQLNYEMIPYTPEDLIDLANKEFAWCDKEMLKASKEMGFGDDWKAALEKVKNTYVPAGKQPEAIMKLYNESIDFLKKNDLITIPDLAQETWGMTMMSPERQLTSPFFLGGADIIISYPTNTMNEDERLMSMRGNNPHFSRATVHHELIAGHNLQQFMNSRYRTYRNYTTPFWTEGWSLYWELLLWDMGFAVTPEDKVGMLFWHMHRCARIIFSLNYHMGKWTPQQCIDFLVDRVGHERANAEGEVRRSFADRYPPLYQLAYLTGGRQFYALHKELVGGGKMTNKQFHDAIIHLNSMPVEMIRAILTNQALTPDFKTSWKFYVPPTP